MNNRNPIWGLFIVAVAAVWLLANSGNLPPTLIDFMGRSLPILLIFVGLLLLLARRLRYGAPVAALLSLTVLGGVAFAGLNQQSGVIRTDYTEPFRFDVVSGVNRLQILVTALNTDIEILPTVGEQAVVGSFVGSSESLASVNFQIIDGVGIFTLAETRRNAIPQFDQIGRGKISLLIPPGVAVEELRISVESGALLINIDQMPVTTANLLTKQGDVTVRFANSIGLIADIDAANGAVTVSVPNGLVAQMNISGARPTFDENVYILDVNNRLVPRSGGQPQAQLNIRGRVVTVQ
jgi:hypothetical protein